MDTKLQGAARAESESEVDAWAEATHRPMRKSAVRAAQTKPAPSFPGMTRRDEANAITCVAFRNGFLEELHADQPSVLAQGASRITDDAMKKLMIESSATLARILELRDEDRTAYVQFLDEARRWVTRWEREAISYDIAPVPRMTCTSCSRTLDVGWSFCPRCAHGTPG